jgi:putative NIF3 family GTP cyclohydrolase 1 type 2
MVTALRGIEIQKYLQSLNRGWVDETDTVDTWKSGDPLVEVRGIAVAWMGYSHALEKAAELGCNLFIVHEPVYYHHRDDDPDILAWPECKARQMTIEKLGLSILRCHDLWDQFPGLGIPDAWGQKLGLGQPLAGEGYLRAYAGHGRTALQIAKELAGRVADLGQPGVQLIGPPERQVQRIVLGTGAATPYREMLIQYEADLVICCDDGFKYWRDGAHAIDNGHSVLIFHHPVTEEYGMQLLAEHLSERFPTIPVHFIPEKCMYQLVLP